MTDIKHTPTPPIGAFDRGDSFTLEINTPELRSVVARITPEGICEEHGTAEEWAERLVRAVNSHDALMAALREANQLLWGLRVSVAQTEHAKAMTAVGQIGPIEHINAVCEHARAALALAGEK